MTNDERDSLIDTLVTQQITLQTNLLGLAASQLKTDRAMRKLSRTARRHEERPAEHSFNIAKLENKLEEITDKINFIIDRDIQQGGTPASR